MVNIQDIAAGAVVIGTGAVAAITAPTPSSKPCPIPSLKRVLSPYAQHPEALIELLFQIQELIVYTISSNSAFLIDEEMKRNDVAKFWSATQVATRDPSLRLSLMRLELDEVWDFVTKSEDRPLINSLIEVVCHPDIDSTGPLNDFLRSEQGIELWVVVTDATRYTTRFGLLTTVRPLVREFEYPFDANTIKAVMNAVKECTREVIIRVLKYDTETEFLEGEFNDISAAWPEGYVTNEHEDAIRVLQKVELHGFVTYMARKAFELKREGMDYDALSQELYVESLLPMVPPRAATREEQIRARFLDLVLNTLWSPIDFSSSGIPQHMLDVSPPPSNDELWDVLGINEEVEAFEEDEWEADFPEEDQEFIPTGPIIATTTLVTPGLGPLASAKDDCPICIENLIKVGADPVKHYVVHLKICNHAYHLDCIDSALNRLEDHSNVCPMCRAQVCEWRDRRLKRATDDDELLAHQQEDEDEHRLHTQRKWVVEQRYSRLLAR